MAALEKLAPAAAALIVEPLLLGAGGMLTYAPDILARMKAICEKHGTLLIADEVLTGFGRTGTLFACEQAGVAPDILCLAKGLTGGALPLAATLATEEIFAAHYSTDRSPHVFSFQFLHRQSAGLRRRPRQSGNLEKRAGGGAHRRPRALPRPNGWTVLPGRQPLFATCARSAPSRRWI